MKKKCLKMLLFMITFGLYILMMYHCAYAASGKDLVGKFDGDLGSDEQKVTNLATKTIGPVLSAIRIIAIGISVIMITYLGIKYVSSAPAEKASIKNQLIALVVGVVLISVATKIIEVMQEASKNLFP